jgi:hypothetical protein
MITMIPPHQAAQAARGTAMTGSVIAIMVGHGLHPGVASREEVCPDHLTRCHCP